MEKISDQKEANVQLFEEHEKRWKNNLPLGVSLQVDWQGADTYSVSLEKIALQTRKVPVDWEKTLPGQAEAIVRRVTFLPENLVLHEFDRIQKKALLRSAVPFRKGQAVSFFEIQLVAGQNVELYRMKNKNHSASHVPFVLDWDLAGRLIDTLADILTRR